MHRIFLDLPVRLFLELLEVNTDFAALIFHFVKLGSMQRYSYCKYLSCKTVLLQSGKWAHQSTIRNGSPPKPSPTPRKNWLKSN